MLFIQTEPRRVLIAAIALAVSVVVPCDARAQSTTRRQPSRTIQSTRVEVQLVTTQPQAALMSQQWGQTFRKIGYAVRIRRADGLDKPEISEKMLGSTRTVKVVGLLTRTGKIQFLGGQEFAPSDDGKLKSWLDNLKKYGAQGAPDGKPLWGLNGKQFNEVFTRLSSPLSEETRDTDLRTAVAKLAVGKQLPIRFSSEATAWLSVQPGPEKTRHTLTGTAKATALAILLADYGLGFQPKRTPTGSIELVILPRASGAKLWPIGWDLTQSNPKTAPLLFKLFPVELDEVAVTDLTKVVMEKTKVPIHFDYAELEAAKIKLEELTVTIPKRKASLYRAVMTAASRNRLAQKLRIDELGKPFIYVSTGAAMRRADEQAVKRPGK